MRVSVVVPAFNAAATLGECLGALIGQSLARGDYEIIVVDDGSSDATREIAAASGVVVIGQPNQGPASARNRGIAAASAPWVAFTDADCVPSRRWLAELLAAVEGDPEQPIGAAGRTIGHGSNSAAAHFADLSGALDAEPHLAHPRFPFAPSCNLLYRRDLLQRVGGFDVRFSSYEACDLHTRLVRLDAGPMRRSPRAVVLHRHRSDWSAYFRQQRSYGRGYAQFVGKYRSEIGWSLLRELHEWARVLRLLVPAISPGDGDLAVMRRGALLKALGQRLGFVSAFYFRKARW